MKTQSKKSRRQDRILKALELNPSMRVGELAAALEVSSETVRRDLAELDATGRIKRTYGGAVRTNTFEPALNDRLKLFIAEREAITQHAIDLLGDADSLFVGGGATTMHFARALKTIERRLTVLTSSFGHALELATNPNFEVISMPGTVDTSEGLAYGPETLRFINRYRPPFAVMGASGIDAVGASEALSSAAQVYEAMIENADKTFILADHSKFNQRSLQMVHFWNNRTTLVTDKSPDDALIDALNACGTKVEIAQAMPRGF